MTKLYKLDDFFNSHDGLFAQANSSEEYVEAYDIALKLALKENRIDRLFQHKLEELTDYKDKYDKSYEFSDFINVIKMLSNKNLENRLNMWDIVNKLELPTNYVNLIYCVLDDIRCLDYETNIQYAWLSSLGREIIQPELGPQFLKFIKETFGEND